MINPYNKHQNIKLSINPLNYKLQTKLFISVRNSDENRKSIKSPLLSRGYKLITQKKVDKGKQLDLLIRLN